MRALTGPNGVEVLVRDSQVEKLVGLGYAEAGKPAEKPKAATRRRAAKPKE